MQESTILKESDTGEVDVVALYIAVRKYEDLKKRGQVDPTKIVEGAYIRALYREEVRNKTVFKFTMEKAKTATTADTVNDGFGKIVNKIIS